MEPIRLWGCADDPYFVRSEPSPYGEGYHEYAALPRAEYDAIVKERDVAVREQEAWRLAYVSQARKQEDATARADAADERAKAAEALLREARVWVHDGVMGRFTPRSCAETVMARIDAHLDGGA